MVHPNYKQHQPVHTTQQLNRRAKACALRQSPQFAATKKHIRRIKLVASAFDLAVWQGRSKALQMHTSSAAEWQPPEQLQGSCEEMQFSRRCTEGRRYSSGAYQFKYQAPDVQ
jgi:hypothetical protein